MQAQSYHKVSKITMDNVEHYPKSNHAEEFWSRALTIFHYDNGIVVSRIPLFFETEEAAHAVHIVP